MDESSARGFAIAQPLCIVGGFVLYTLSEISTSTRESIVSVQDFYSCRKKCMRYQGSFKLVATLIK